MALGLLTVVLIALAACSGSGTGAAKAKPSASTTSTPAPPSPQQLAAFCEAITALDKTDGTTAESVVLKTLDDLRRAAPDAVASDVNLLADNLIVNNYPGGVTESMKAPPAAEATAAGERLGKFVDQNCDMAGS